MLRLGLGLGLEEVLGELKEDANEQGLPPGFRFHPTDGELITFYLASQVFNPNAASFSPTIKIAQVDLNRCEPWDLPDVSKMGEREWYFFSIRDRKYPVGLRTNRATGAGYWKATGKDRKVHGNNNVLVGMKKTLVFYKGRAPRGEKTRWVMHEYRLDGQLSCRQTCKEEWVICRIFHKIKEKKPPIFQGHHMSSSYFLSPPSSPLPTFTAISPPLPSLLEFERDQIRQADVQNHQLPSITNAYNGNIKDLQLPHLAKYKPNQKGSNTNNHPSVSPSNVLVESFLSHHACGPLDEDPTSIAPTTTISKRFKTEANFSTFPKVPTHHANLPWCEQQQHSGFNGLDFSSLGFSPLGPTAAAADHSLLVGTSACFDFNRAFVSATAASAES